MATIETRDTQAGVTYRVYWDLPRALVPAGQRRAKGSLTVYQHSHALMAVQFAEAAGHAILGEVVEQKLEEALRPRLRTGLTLRGWVPQYLDSVKQDIRLKTWRTYRTQLDHFCDEMGDTILEDVSALQIKNVLLTIKEKRGITFVSCDRHLAALKACLQVAVKDRKVKHNAAKAVDWKMGKRERGSARDDLESEKFFELPEYQMLITQFRPDYRLFVEFLCETGARFSEAASLLVSDLDFERNIAHVQAVWDNEFDEDGLPKSSKPRWIHVPKAIMGRISTRVREKADTDRVFTTVRGSFIDNSNFRRDHWDPAMVRLRQCPRHLPERIDGRNGLNVYDPHSPSTCNCLGLRHWTGFTPHALRHTYATWMIRKGVPVALIARQLGHTTTKMTETVYAHLKHYWVDEKSDLTRTMDEIQGRVYSDEAFAV